MNSPLSQNQSLITILNLPWILAVLNLNYAQSRKLPSMNHKPSTQNLGSSNSYLIPKISDVQAQRNNIWENTYSILHVRWLDMKFVCITSSSIHPTKCIDDLYFIHRLVEREKSPIRKGPNFIDNNVVAVRVWDKMSFSHGTFLIWWGIHVNCGILYFRSWNFLHIMFRWKDVKRTWQWCQTDSYADRWKCCF